MAWCLHAALPRRRNGTAMLSPGVALALAMSVFAWMGTIIAAVTPLPDRATFLLSAGVLVIAALLRWKLRGHRFPLPRLPMRPGRPAEALLLTVLALGLLLHLRYAGVLLVNYDVLSYHLTLAQEFRAYLSGDKRMFYSGMPMGLSAVLRFTGTSGTDGTGMTTAITLSSIGGALCAARMARWLGGRRWAPVTAAALFLWMPGLQRTSWQGLPEPLLVLQGMAAMECLLAAVSRRRCRAAALLAGWFAGTAAAMKLSALGVVAVPLLVLVLMLWREPRAMLRISFAVVFAIALALAPWVVRATVMKGGGMPALTFWSTEQADFVVQSHQPQRPWKLSYWQSALHRLGSFGYAPPQVLLLGESTIPVWPSKIPEVPGLLLLAAGMANKRRGGALLLAAMAAYGPFLLLRTQPERFHLPAALWLCAPAAVFLCSPGVRSTGLRMLRGVGLLMVLLCVVDVASLGSRMPAFLSPEDTAEFRGELLGTFPEAVYAPATDAAGEGKVLVLFEARHAFFRAQDSLTTVWDIPAWYPLLWDAARSPGGAADLARRLREAGFTHLVVNEAELTRLLLFYAKGENPSLGPGQAGLRSPNFRGELRSYPAFRSAGMSEEEATVLESLLRDAHRGRLRGSPAGPVSEIWCAPIPHQ